MIKVLGTKRILVLLLLLGLNLVFAGGVYMYLTPEKMTKDRELRQVRGQIIGLQSDIERIQIEFDQLEDQQAQFDILKKEGFFGSQGRRQAEQVFERIQKEAGVISAVASIQAGVVEDSEEAAKAEHKILKSPITVRIESLDDIDVFKYLYLVEQFFPGHVTLTRINLERKAEVSGTILRGIASGGNPELVEADIEMVWRTMIPETSIIAPAPEGGSL